MSGAHDPRRVERDILLRGGGEPKSEADARVLGAIRALQQANAKLEATAFELSLRLHLAEGEAEDMRTLAKRCAREAAVTVPGRLDFVEAVWAIRERLCGRDVPLALRTELAALLSGMEEKRDLMDDAMIGEGA